MAKGKKAQTEKGSRTQENVAADTPEHNDSTSFPFVHYASRTPLQLAFIAFSLLQARDRSDSSANVTNIARTMEALVSQPAKMLSWTCAGVALVQIWFGLWARSCRVIPSQQSSNASGQQLRSNRGVQTILSDLLKNGPKNPAHILRELPRHTDHFLVHLLNAVLVTIGGSLVIHVAAVLLGAPVLRDALKTYLLSLLVALLSVTPIAVSVPLSEKFVWQRLISTLVPVNDVERALLAPAIGALAGCWLGAIPIPLDWDRPWQSWPTTCVIGTLLGHTIGSCVGVILCFIHTSS